MSNITKILCTAFFSIACFQAVQGQEKNDFKNFHNNVRIELSGFEPSEPFETTSTFTFFRQIGFYYGRQVYKNFHLSAGYNQWYNFGSSSITREPALINPKFFFNRNIPVGTISFRRRYKNFDLAALYNIATENKKHNITSGVGICYTTGINDTITLVAVNPEPFGDHDIFSGSEEVNYTGIIPQVYYNYFFLHNRVNIGAHLKYRKYLKTDLTMLELGIQVGFNF